MSKANLRADKARPIHRILGTIILVFTLYIGVTGLMIQAVDLRAVLSHAAGTDPDMMAIRESINGSGDFAVVEPTDYAAAALPDGFDFISALSNVLKSARSSLGASKPFKFVEFES